MAGIIAAKTDNAHGHRRRRLRRRQGHARHGPRRIRCWPGQRHHRGHRLGRRPRRRRHQHVLQQSTGYSAALQAAIDYAWANNVVLVAATGNDGSSAVTFPAGDRGVIGVSNTDQNDALSPSSNSGDAVFLGAPGTDILTTAAGGGTTTVTGTSASAAEVAGAAALFKAIDPTASNGIIVNRLARNAVNLGTPAETGNGRLDVTGAAFDVTTASVEPAGTGPGLGTGGPYVADAICPATGAVPFTGTSGAAPAGDYASVATGNWNAGATWQHCLTSTGVWTADGTVPTNGSGIITIQGAHTVTVTAAATANSVVVNGTLTVNSSQSLTTNGASPQITVNGIVNANGLFAGNAGSGNTSFNVFGLFNVGSVGSVTVGGNGAIFNVGTGGNLVISSGGSLTGSGNQNATFAIVPGGSATLNGAVSGFGQVTFSGTVTSSANITVVSVSNLQVSGTLTMTAGTLSLSRGNSGTTGNINSGGTIALQGSSILTIGGNPQATFHVATGGTLDAGPTAYVTGTGFLAVDSGATLKIGHANGITTTSATPATGPTACTVPVATGGNVQACGDPDTYSTGANYEYKGTAAQVTGNALPATVNNLTINNTGPANVTLTSSVTVSGNLALTSGDLVTGANNVTESATGTTSGTTDVVGTFIRTTPGTASLTYGNPNNVIQASATAPTQINVVLAKSSPAGKPGAVSRTYTISTTPTSGFTASVQLHYLDPELNGNTESSLELWRAATAAGPFVTQGKSANDTTNNWVKQVSVTAANLNGAWTLANGPTATLTPGQDGHQRQRRHGPGQRLDADGDRSHDHLRQHRLRGRHERAGQRRHVHPVRDRPRRLHRQPVDLHQRRHGQQQPDHPGQRRRPRPARSTTTTTRPP